MSVQMFQSWRHFLLVQELLGALQRGNESGKQQAALLLWQLLNAASAASTNPALAAQCAASNDLVPGISWALHAQSWAAAGIVQALTYDDHRWVDNRPQKHVCKTDK